MFSDLRRAARALRRSPSFSLAAVLSLAVGIGAATAIFTVLYAVLLRPLPYRDPSRLVVLLHDGQFAVSPADYLDYQRDSHSYVTLAAAQVSGVTLTGSGDSLRIDGLQVTANMFDVLGVPAALGRTFVRGDDIAGHNRVVVLSDSLWRERFGADPSLVGRTILLDGDPHVVVGIMPPSFRFAPFWATSARLWRPLSFEQRIADRNGRSLRLFARLKDGVALEQAQAEATGIARRLAAAYPDSNADLGISVVPLHEKVTAPIRPTLVMLFAMVLLVLLVAAVNVASLLLVRGTARQKELAVRTALGAGRARLVNELLAESVILGVAGGVAALVLSSWAVSSLTAMLPEAALPRQQEIGSSVVVFAVAACVAMVSALLAGLAPALQLSRVGVTSALRDGGRTATDHGHRTTRRSLLAVEFALATMLLAGAGLMGRSLLALQAIEPGFDPSHVLALTVPVDGLPQADPLKRAPYYDAVAAALEAVPGVERVGAINHLPLAGDTWRFRVSIEGQPIPPPSERAGATWRVVRPGYFEAMRLPVRGRTISDRDGMHDLPVVVINQSFVSKHFAGEDPVGHRIRVGTDDGPWMTVVGVSANARQSEWSGPVPEEVYVPYAQHAGEFGGAELTFVLRTSADPAALASTASRAVWSVDPGVPIAQLTTMERVVRDRLWRARVTAWLLGGFAGVAVLLAAIGIYGLTAYVVSRRTREIGIRMALGAQSADVVKLTLNETILPVAAGVAAGCVASLALARVAESLLYGVTPSDPETFGAVVILLAAVALAAGWIPSRRATRIDPLAALRED